MDTKWKRSKAVCGFVSFALGVSLVLSSLLPSVGYLAGGSRDRLGDALKREFQETDSFRTYLCGMMDTFIAMGAGGPVSGSYYDYYDSDVYTDVIMEAATIAQEGGYDFYLDDSLPAQPSESTKERWKKEAEAYHQAIQNDKNILYQIRRDGKVLYSNIEEFHYDHANHPTGYNTILSFANGRCIVTVGNQEVKIYGENNSDLYVDDGKHWYLPGYVNFPAGKETDGVDVCMVVADTPTLYLSPDYSSGNRSLWQYNRLYQLEKNWREARQELVVRGSICLGVGLLFLGVWFLLRREKPLADRAIARFTGHIWFELKLLLLLGSLVLLVLPLTEEMRYLFREVTFAFSIEDVGYYQAPWFLGEYFREITRRPAAVLAAVWVLYLFINDLRYGDKPWRHGICGMLTARGLKMPIQKRLSRRAAASVLFPILALLLFFPGFRFINTRGVNFYAAFVGWAAAELLLLFVMQCLYAKKNAALARDLGCLTDYISAVKDGNFTGALSLPIDSDLGKAAQEITDIQQGMAQAVAEQTRSERMKVELVTNVSHDLKTPLTSIISYAELLKQEDLAPPAGEYVDILAQKAERLRAMVLDVFEVSKAASGELPVKPERLDLAKLLRQTTADMAQEIDAAPVTLRQALPEEAVTIVADGDRLYRVFQNLLQNALKYALEGSRVYLALGVRDGTAVVSVKNTSKTELPEGVDFTARFVRGDQSRTDGGSGLGLAIAESFTAACGGTLRVEPVADLFVVTVEFPLAGEREEPPAVMDAEIAE